MIKIIGGTYEEINLDITTYNILGSGLRSLSFILENSKQDVEFFTRGNEKVAKHLSNYMGVYNNLHINISNSEHLLTFKYYFALDNPSIYPNPSTLKDIPILKASKGDFICFGMLDGDFEIDGNKVVYDPQTYLNPTKFSKRSNAKELIYVVNLSEAKSFANSSDMESILEFFFDEEKVKALIIKNGPHGAIIYLNKEEVYNIPAYKTDVVNKIGSGDIFTTAFAYYWFDYGELSIQECALYASKTTAIYCDNETYEAYNIKASKFNYNELETKKINEKQVYIASPIFSLSEIVLVDKIRDSLIDLGVKVFSPYHDVGYGNEKLIAEKDIRGIDESDIIFCVLDGLDSGTLIELGYAMSKGKEIIGYHRTVNSGDLLMLEMAKIKYFNELTTALYQTIWSL